MLLTDKVAIVTGGGTGIGRAIAHELASLGAHVIIAARKEERLAKTAAEINESGGKASFYTVNIRREEQVAQLIKQIVQDHGTIDALVNNAALGGFIHKFGEFPMDKWDTMTSVNLRISSSITSEVRFHQP